MEKFGVTGLELYLSSKAALAVEIQGEALGSTDEMADWSVRFLNL